MLLCFCAGVLFLGWASCCLYVDGSEVQFFFQMFQGYSGDISTDNIILLFNFYLCLLWDFSACRFCFRQVLSAYIMTVFSRLQSFWKHSQSCGIGFSSPQVCCPMFRGTWKVILCHFVLCQQLHHIVCTQGHLPQHLLNNGFKTHCFFQRKKGRYPFWRLKVQDLLIFLPTNLCLINLYHSWWLFHFRHQMNMDMKSWQRTTSTP